jgi:hypothetical protein
MRKECVKTDTIIKDINQRKQHTASTLINLTMLVDTAKIAIFTNTIYLKRRAAEIKEYP